MATRRRVRPRRNVSKAARGSKRGSKRAHAKAGSRKAAPRKAASKRRPSVSKPSRQPAARPAAPALVPNGIGLANHHMDYTSHDVDGIKRFYTELLGFKKFVVDPQMNYLYVQTGSTSSLGFMPPMPGPPEQWRPPREPSLYFMVQDVDRVHRDLVAKGVTFDQEPQDMPWGHRVALLHDPEGRTVCLAQVLG
jgi:predicted enzyme related to lactoylglutathione lyase